MKNNPSHRGWCNFEIKVLCKTTIIYFYLFLFLEFLIVKHFEVKANSIVLIKEDQRGSNVISGSDPFEIWKNWCSVTPSYSGESGLKRIQDDNFATFWTFWGSFFLILFISCTRAFFLFKHAVWIYANYNHWFVKFHSYTF